MQIFTVEAFTFADQEYISTFTKKSFQREILAVNCSSTGKRRFTYISENPGVVAGYDEKK